MLTNIVTVIPTLALLLIVAAYYPKGILVEVFYRSYRLAMGGEGDKSTDFHLENYRFRTSCKDYRHETFEYNF